jgi:predicted oxidoreductase
MMQSVEASLKRLQTDYIDLLLSADQLKVLDEASRIELGFPCALYSMDMVRALMHGGMSDQIVT